MKKLINTANVLDVIAKIFQICSLIAVIMLLAAIILLTVFKTEAFEFSGSLELGHFSFDLAFISPDVMHRSFVCTAAPAAVVAAVLWLILRTARSILAPMKEGRPFSSAVSSGLRTLSLIVLIGGALTQAMEGAAHWAMHRLFDFPSLFLSQGITGCSFDFTFDMTFIIGFLILSMLSLAFRYGEELQQQSDETL